MSQSMWSFRRKLVAFFLKLVSEAGFSDDLGRVEKQHCFLPKSMRTSISLIWNIKAIPIKLWVNGNLSSVVCIFKGSCFPLADGKRGFEPLHLDSSDQTLCMLPTSPQVIV